MTRALKLAIASIFVATRWMPNGYEFETCRKCRRYLSHGAALSLQVHLAGDHHLSVDNSIKISNHFYREFLRRERP